jgi:Replicative DNA helicase
MSNIPSELIHPTAELVVAAGIVQDALSAEPTGELLETVTPADFSSENLQFVIEATGRLLRGTEPIDAAGIVREAEHVAKERQAKRFGVTLEFVHRLKAEDARRAPAYAHTVKRFAWLRSAKGFADWYLSELSTLPDPEELYKKAQDALTFLRPPSKAGRFLYGWDTADYAATLAKRKEDAEKGATLKYDWPWWMWNKHVKPLRAGMVGLLAGPEGSGKTGYLEMIAEHWATKRHVIFVHLENNHEYTLDRRMARHSHLPIDLLEEARLTPEQLEAVTAGRHRVDRFALQLHYLDAAGMAMTDIVDELRTRKEEGICDAVVLDYLNKVRASRGQVKLYAADAIARQADDMEQFKSFCEQAGIVGMTAAQYNKDGKRGTDRKRSYDIRGSGELADKAQLVVLLAREVLEANVKDARGNIIAHAGEDNPVVEVRVDKQNRGRKCEFEQVYKGEFFEVRDKPNV